MQHLVCGVQTCQDLPTQTSAPQMSLCSRHNTLVPFPPLQLCSSAPEIKKPKLSWPCFLVLQFLTTSVKLGTSAKDPAPLCWAPTMSFHFTELLSRSSLLFS